MERKSSEIGKKESFKERKEVKRTESLLVEDLSFIQIKIIL